MCWRLRIIRPVGGLLASLLILVSACSSSEPAATADRVEALQERIAELEEENTALEEQVDALRSTTTVSTTTAAPSTTTTSTIPVVLLRGDITMHANATTFSTTKVGLRVDEERRYCWGQPGYDDLAEGASVVVTDETGSVVATGTLTAGQYDEMEYHDDIQWSTGYCTWAFETTIPGDRPFYAVEVNHRGKVTFSREDLEAADWYAALSL